MSDEIRPSLDLRPRLTQEASDFFEVAELDDRRVLERCVHWVVFRDSVGGQRLRG